MFYALSERKQDKYRLSPTDFLWGKGFDLNPQIMTKSGQHHTYGMALCSFDEQGIKEICLEILEERK